MTPATRWPLCSSAMETQKTGKPWAKLVVPSSGSTYQRVAASVQQAAFFAEDVVRRPVFTQALADEGFGLAVGDGDQVGFALVFDGYVAMEILHEQGAGFAGNLRGGRNDVGLGGGSHRLLALASVFRDVHDFVLENEEIGLCFASKADHVFVVVFDPAVDDLAIGQLDAHRLLLFGERLQIRGFFRSFLGR